jgi:formylglycine-generating enzyme required for sulfatase activity
MIGDAADPEGRKHIDGHKYVSPPAFAAYDPEGRLLGQTQHTDSVEQTLSFLTTLLLEHPDLAGDWTPDADYSPYDRNDPAQVRLLELETRIPMASAAEQADIERELTELFASFVENKPEAAALAGVLLGDSRFYLGDFRRANAAWAEVVERWPQHPLSHRARHNLLDKAAYPTGWHPSLQSAPRRPSAAEFPTTVPFPEVRIANLEQVKSDPRYRVLLDGLPFVKIPAGTFLMGGSPARFRRELPVRKVTITQSFWISAWPVTRAIWLRYRPDAWSGAESEGLELELPAGSISHTEAVEYAAFLSKQTGAHFRLPTEAEWEYAARGGLEGAQYPWGNDPIDPTRANTDRPRLVPVACYPANAYGLFDMVGNTAEWAADIFLDDGYSLTPPEVTDPLAVGESLDDPLAPPDSRRSVRRVMRASFSGNEFCYEMARNSFRQGVDEWVRAPGLAFRLVVPADD